jgi:hypothetical protein
LVVNLAFVAPFAPVAVNVSSFPINRDQEPAMQRVAQSPSAVHLGSATLKLPRKRLIANPLGFAMCALKDL